MIIFRIGGRKVLGLGLLDRNPKDFSGYIRKYLLVLNSGENKEPYKFLRIFSNKK